LRQIGDVIEGHTRRGDIVARLGGDEFGIVLTHCSLTEAKRVANAVLEVIRAFRFVWEDKGFTVGASIGLVPIKAQATNMTEILQEADSACYLAKDNGRNRIHVYRDNDKDQAKRRGEMQWVQRINSALEEDRIYMHLQEIGAIGEATGPGRHYELLVRMETDAGQLVDAGLFLPAAERYNLATKLDRRVIQIVFDWLRRRDGETNDQDVFAINLSGQSLGDEDFLSFLLARLEECPVHPGRICFEITETAAIANLSDATRFFRELKGKGCRFALDDFGSGLSSFGYLKSLPVDYLKIDGAFVKGIVEDPVDLAMVKSINDMGHVLGKKTIAEFVESQAIYERLSEIGVDFAQGYFIGRPQPVHANLALP
jgi:EAL domain-containing protein (putative c-di-GMP-specific phosphodiesterase class I)